MGDELVMAVRQSLEDVAFANGMDLPGLDPIIDTIVNRLRNAGYTDKQIEAALVPPANLWNAP